MERISWKRDSASCLPVLVAFAVFISGLIVAGTVLSQDQAPTGPVGCRSFEQSEDIPGCPVPAEYAGKHMPKGGWTNPDMISKGEIIFQAICAECHGKEGKPKLAGARNFRDAKKMNAINDFYWFWRVSEGIPGTKMPPWKGALTEEQRWQVMAYEHRFSHDLKAEAHTHPGLDGAAQK